MIHPKGQTPSAKVRVVPGPTTLPLMFFPRGDPFLMVRHSECEYPTLRSIEPSGKFSIFCRMGSNKLPVVCK